MTIKVKVLVGGSFKGARIAPVRFARAVEGFCVADAPDPDEHGVSLRNPGPAVPGPRIGVTRGRTVRVLVVRDRLDPKAALFAVSSDPTIAEVVHPAAGAPLSPDDLLPGRTYLLIRPTDSIWPVKLAEICTGDARRYTELNPLNPHLTNQWGEWKDLYAGDEINIPPEWAEKAILAGYDIRGNPFLRQGNCVFVRGASKAGATAQASVRLHHGSPTGPRVAELSVLVHPPLDVKVQAHAVTINGQAPTMTLERLRALFDGVNAVYSPAGIRFVLADKLLPKRVTGMTTPGTVTITSPQDETDVELRGAMGGISTKGALNVHLVNHFFDATLTPPLDMIVGIGFSRSHVRGFPGCPVGIILRDDPDIVLLTTILAHEIGHALTLDHYNLQAHTRTIWGRKNLMFPAALMPVPPGVRPSRVNVGYGVSGPNPRAGQLLMCQSNHNVAQSDQVDLMRTAVLGHEHEPL